MDWASVLPRLLRISRMEEINWRPSGVSSLIALSGREWPPLAKSSGFFNTEHAHLIAESTSQTRIFLSQSVSSSSGSAN